MKVGKKEFIERLLKLSYHRQMLDSLCEDDKNAIDLVLMVDNLKYIDDEEVHEDI